MGTNYYRVKPLTEEQRQEAHRKLDEVLDDKIPWWDFQEMVEGLDKQCRTHICKTSFGWQVCFDHNWGKYYQPNRKSLEEFLSEEGTYIKDEYGDKISYKDFWDMVKKHNENPCNDWTSLSYRQDNPDSNDDSYYCREYISKCKGVFGIDSKGETDFDVDGLRFAVYSDFS